MVADGWRLIGLNAQLFGTDSDVEGEQWGWLVEQIDAASQQPTALLLHKPLFQGGPEFNHVNIMAVCHGTEKDRVFAHKAAIDAHLASIGMPVSYTNVFWGGRSEIKPSEISPRIHREWLEKMSAPAAVGAV